jgi:hypothetical protein
MERRKARRARFGTIFLNKYVDGFPHLVKLVNVSAGGMLVRKLHEPDVDREDFALELGVPGQSERMWLWTWRVWETRELTALRFGMGAVDRIRLMRMLGEARRAVRPASSLS